MLIAVQRDGPGLDRGGAFQCADRNRNHSRLLTLGSDSALLQLHGHGSTRQQQADDVIVSRVTAVTGRRMDQALRIRACRR